MLIKKLQEYADYALFADRFADLLEQFEEMGLACHDELSELSFYFQRLLSIFEKMQSAEEAYKVLQFFYYLLASYQNTPGARAALQLTNICEISFDPFFRMLEEKNTCEDGAKINLSSTTFYFRKDKPYVNLKNEKDLSFDNFLQTSLKDESIVVDSLGHVYVSSDANKEFISSIKIASPESIQADLFVWYALTIKKIIQSYNFITDLPLDFFIAVEFAEAMSPQEVITRLIQQNIEQKVEPTEARLTAIKNFIVKGVEYLDVNFIVSYVENFIPHNERPTFLNKIMQRVAKFSNVVTWYESLGLDLADKVISLFARYNVTNVLWIYTISPYLRMTNVMQSFAHEKNLQKFIVDFNKATLPIHHLNAFQKPPVCIENDTSNSFSQDEMMLAETFLLNQYKTNLANRFEDEFKQDLSSNPIELFYIPSALTGINENADKFEFHYADQIKALVNSASSDRHLVFCGIAQTRRNYLTPFLITAKEVICLSVKSDFDKTFMREEALNVKLRGAFKELFPEKNVYDPNIIHNIRVRFNEWCALFNLETIIRLQGSPDSLLTVVNNEVKFAASRLPLNMNNFSWDRDKTGYLYYSPISYALTEGAVQWWFEILRRTDELHTVVYDGEINLQTQFSFSSLGFYDAHKAIVSLATTGTIQPDSLLVQLANKIAELQNSGLIALNLARPVQDFINNLHLPNNAVIQAFSTELKKQIQLLEEELNDENVPLDGYVNTALTFHFQQYYEDAIEIYFQHFFKQYQLVDLDEGIESIVSAYFTESKVGFLFSNFNARKKTIVFSSVHSHALKYFTDKKIQFGSEIIEAHINALLPCALQSLTAEENATLVMQLDRLVEYVASQHQVQQVFVKTPQIKFPNDMLREKIQVALVEQESLYSRHTLNHFQSALRQLEQFDYQSLNMQALLLPQLNNWLPENDRDQLVLSRQDFSREQYTLYHLLFLRVAESINAKLSEKIFEHFENWLNRKFSPNLLRGEQLSFLISVYFEPNRLQDLTIDEDFAANTELYAFATEHVFELLQGQLIAFLRERYVEFYELLLSRFSSEKCIIVGGVTDIPLLISKVTQKLVLHLEPLHFKYTYGQLFSVLFIEDLKPEINNRLVALNILRLKLTRACDALDVICEKVNTFPRKKRLDNPLHKYTNRLHNLEMSLQDLEDWTLRIEDTINQTLKNFCNFLFQEIKKGYLGTMHHTSVLRYLMAKMLNVILPNQIQPMLFVLPAEAVIIEAQINLQLKTITLDSIVDSLTNTRVTEYIDLKNVPLGNALSAASFKIIMMKWYELIYQHGLNYTFLKFYEVLRVLDDIQDSQAPLGEQWCKQTIRPILQDVYVHYELKKDATTKQFVNCILYSTNVLSNREQKAEIDEEVSFVHLVDVLSLYQTARHQQDLQRFFTQLSYNTGKQNLQESPEYFQEPEPPAKLFKSLFHAAHSKEERLVFTIQLIRERHLPATNFNLNFGDVALLEDMLSHRWNELNKGDVYPANYQTLHDPIDRIYLLIATMLKSAFNNFGIVTTVFQLLMPGAIAKGDLSNEIKDDSLELCVDDYNFADVITLNDGRWLDQKRLLYEYKSLGRIQDHFTKQDLKSKEVEYLFNKYPYLQKPLQKTFIYLHCHVFDKNLKNIFLNYLKNSVFGDGWNGLYNRNDDERSHKAYVVLMDQLKPLSDFQKEILFATAVPRSDKTLGEVLEGKVYSNCITYTGLGVAKVLWRYYKDITLKDLGPGFEAREADFEGINRVERDISADKLSIQPNEMFLKQVFLQQHESKTETVSLQFR